MQPRPAPDFRGVTVDGKPLTLSDFRGKRAVALCFYQNHCAACMDEFPKLVDLSRRHPKVAFVAVPLEKKRDEAARWRGVYRATFPFLFDPELRVARAYGVRATPTVVLIDKRGDIVGGVVGFDPKSLRAAVAQLAAG